MSNTTNSSQQYASVSQRYPDPIQQSRPSLEFTDFHKRYVGKFVDSINVDLSQRAGPR